MKVELRLPAKEDVNQIPKLSQVNAPIFRVSDYDVPFWVRKNSRAGRWHRQESKLIAQYWTFAPHTAFAELLRSTGVIDPDDYKFIKTRMWVSYARLQAVADLRQNEWLSYLGLAEEQLTAEPWLPCQQAAEKLVALAPQAEGIVVPSAALPHRCNLVIFGRRLQASWIDDLQGPQKPQSQLMIPAKLFGVGQPHSQLAGTVVHRAHKK